MGVTVRVEVRETTDTGDAATTAAAFASPWRQSGSVP